MQNDIFLPVEKLPVPPDKTDLMMIRLLESSFIKQEDGTIQEFRKIYYETYFEGKKVSDGNNTILASLVPLIYNANSHKEMMDMALQGFGFKLIHEVFDENQNIFQNPYQSQNIIDNNLPVPNTNEAETNTTTSTETTEAGTTTATEQSAVTPAN
ncbi:hypothetical protein LV89_01848 [Arcicella aurantiaca]|uniref:Uncharacterized protein n=1 Tax=Arcicella aurantiaca TaxID=591202 RepID=A0A316EUW7_9BACT|nr:hypothetical protein [Arcicella aurantiaca]PWK27036.1 hypothetical protein LV89_01848 [Arcicella aurantiaca]